jgi:flagellar M-ring protein FliF
MNERLQRLWNQAAAFLLGLPPARRVTILAVGLASMAAVLGLAWWVQRPLYRPLFTNLSESDAAAIVEALKAEKVPFTLEDGGRAVLVPASRLYELRLALAGRGLPEGGGVGFEVFDKQSLGQTDFLQRLNYQRALQGELARTIGQLGGVDSARVHLALPERSLFVAEDRRPTASVVVRLAAGRTLSRAQIDGIVHLVASSVEGLAAESVTVVDEGGRILTPDRRGADASGVSSAALEHQLAVERQITERVESMLAAVVGRDKAIARVAARLDFSRVERTEEVYDPDRTALKTGRTTREQTLGPRAPGGAPGVQANLTNDAAAVPESEGPRSERRDESQTYEVTKTVSHTVAPVGELKQLSVAVLIDGTYSEQGGKRTFTPRPQEELDRLAQLVKSAVGFSAERGDTIEVASVPFQAEPLPAGESVLASVGRWAPAVLMRLLAVVFVAAILLYVVRPLVVGLATRPLPVRQRLAAGGPAAAVSALTQENLALAQQDPERAAQLVREWLHEGTPAIEQG